MTPDVLLVAADRACRDFLLTCLGRRPVTVATWPDQAERLLATHRYALVLITNFGVPTYGSVAIIPAERDYPVLFVSGYVDDRLEAECAEKNIPWLRAPVEMGALRRELRIALEDLTV